METQHIEGCQFNQDNIEFACWQTKEGLELWGKFSNGKIEEADQ